MLRLLLLTPHQLPTATQEIVLVAAGQEGEAILPARAQEIVFPVAAQEVGAALRGSGGGYLDLPTGVLRF